MKYQLKKYSNLPLSQYIEYENGAIIKLYNKVDYKILTNGNKKEIMQAYRNKLRPKKSFKYVMISYECDIFSTVSNSWHHVTETRKFNGAYNHVSEIKKCLDTHKLRNKEDIENGILKNLHYKYEFLFK